MKGLLNQTVYVDYSNLPSIFTLRLKANFVIMA